MTTNIDVCFSEMKQTQQKNVLHSIQERKKVLKNIFNLVVSREKDILKALKLDLNKSEFEAYVTEISLVKKEIKYFLSNLSKLCAPKKVSTPLVFQPGKSYVKATPKGIILIISPWNYPFLLALSPLVGAIAAGNCVLLKPSEYSSHTSSLIEDIFRDSQIDYIKVFNGDAEISKELVQKDLDHIFYTGGTAVGREIMLHAAKKLVPITLELGGKSPCLVHDSANISLSAKRIVWGKFLNAGQTCVAPDYVLVTENKHDELISSLKYFMEKMFKEYVSSNSWGKIINQKHFSRIKNFLGDGQIVTGGKCHENSLSIEPTLLKNISIDDKIMQEEIFGPVLPVLKIPENEYLEIVKKNQHPLALYIFAQDKNYVHRVISNSISGSVCVNDCVSQIAILGLPFGGVRSSGIGNYHGEHSFNTFSHFRSVHERSLWFDSSLRYPPYSQQKLQAVKFVI